MAIRNSRLPTVAKKHRRIHPVYAQTCAEHGEGICCAEMRLSAALFPLLCAAGLFLLAGCNTQSQTAVVVSKEFIPAQIIPADGTEPARQEGATPHDRLLVQVAMADGKKALADVQQAQWDELRVGDKVKATYKQGKYTGTVWYVELRKETPAATP